MKTIIFISVITAFGLAGCVNLAGGNTDATPVTPDTSLPASCEQFYSAINTLAQDKPPEIVAQFRQMVADKRKAWKKMSSAERREADKQCVMLQQLYFGKH